MSEKLTAALEPCLTCPYRKDTPLGIWHPEEYAKLAGYDHHAIGVFLCHNGFLERRLVCRGWLSVHCESVAVRIAVSNGQIDDDLRYKKVKAPLYSTGTEAMLAGLKGVRKPKAKARAAIRQINSRLNWQT